MPEQLQNQTPTTPDSLLLSPEDLAAKQAKWQAEGYTEEEVEELTQMLQRLSEIQKIYKDSLKPNEYWLAHPDEKAEFLELAEKLEKEKVEIGVKRYEIQNNLAEKKEQEKRRIMENLEGRDPERFLTEVFDWMDKHRLLAESRDTFNWAYEDGYINCGLLIPPGLPEEFVDQRIEDNSNLPKYELSHIWSGQAKGISNLIEKLKGKKVLSLIAAGSHWKGQWLLKIIEPKKGEPKTFTRFGNGTNIETTGELESEKFPFRVGDRLKVKPDINGYPSDIKAAIMGAKEIKVVGFSEHLEHNCIVIQLDSGPAILVADWDNVEKDFEKIN